MSSQNRPGSISGEMQANSANIKPKGRGEGLAHTSQARVCSTTHSPLECTAAYP